MNVPISWIFVVWLILAGIFGLIALLTITTVLRYGPKTAATYIYLAIFIGVGALVFIAVGGYALSVDWTQTFPILGGLGSTPTITY